MLVCGTGRRGYVSLRKGMLLRAWAAVFSAVFFFPLPGDAQQTGTDTAIANGVAYLRSSQNPDGSWGGTPTSLTTIFQTTATTARTFQLLGLTDTSLTTALNFLSAQTPTTVDDLAHQLEVLAGSGTNVSGVVAALTGAQQTDGGWGIDLEKTFPSEVVDNTTTNPATILATFPQHGPVTWRMHASSL